MICLDSNILISLLNEHEQTQKWIARHSETILCVTSLSIFELYYGYFLNKKKKMQVDLDKFFQNFYILELQSKYMRNAAEISAQLEKKGLRIEIVDIFIAAACIENNVSLKTHNKRHFARIDELKVMD